MTCIGDKIQVTCRLSEDAVAQTYVNQAAIGYNDKEIYAQTTSLSVGRDVESGSGDSNGNGGTPRTGDYNELAGYTVIPLLALLTMAVLWKYERKKYRI